MILNSNDYHKQHPLISHFSKLHIRNIVETIWMYILQHLLVSQRAEKIEAENEW